MTSRSPHYQIVLPDLRMSYDRSAEYRDAGGTQPWKVAQRTTFLERLQSASAHSLLEVGAGVGGDSLFFQDNGLKVTATDLSPEMVRFCRKKGLNAHVTDFWELEFPAGSFDAMYAMNCLLHVPSADFQGVLEHIRQVMKPGGLFFLGQYGGGDQEGIREDDYQSPPRFFCHYSDERILSIVSQIFDVIEFEPVDIGSTDRIRTHFQSLTLRKARKFNADIRHTP